VYHKEYEIQLDAVVYIESQYGTCSPACMLQISLLYAGRAVQIVVMMGCYDLLCTWCDARMLQPYCTR
jgi:hypothetical protein